MNPDLKFRLERYETCSHTDRVFFIHLVQKLLGHVKHTTNIDFQPIENGEDDSAYVEYDGNIFNVVIDSRMPLGMMLDFCLHELAHVISWRKWEKDDHGPEWGKAYAYMYRKYLEIYGELIKMEHIE